MTLCFYYSSTIVVSIYEQGVIHLLLLSDDMRNVQFDEKLLSSFN